MEPDGDLPPDPVVADSLDDLLNGRDLAGTIRPFPFSGIGHQTLGVIGIYAKLDLASLAKVALPWPGGAQ